MQLMANFNSQQKLPKKLLNWQGHPESRHLQKKFKSELGCIKLVNRIVSLRRSKILSGNKSTSSLSLKTLVSSCFLVQ